MTSRHSSQTPDGVIICGECSEITEVYCDPGPAGGLRYVRKHRPDCRWWREVAN